MFCISLHPLPKMNFFIIFKKAVKTYMLFIKSGPVHDFWNIIGCINHLRVRLVVSENEI